MDVRRWTGKAAGAIALPRDLDVWPGWRWSSLPWAETKAKRLMDCAAAIVGLATLAPVMVVVGVLVRLTSPGPALYAQTRVGQHGTRFTMWKFRTMTVEAEADGQARWAQSNDPRVTPIGRYLRMWRVDELPQLWNIWQGDMSLVGPRPERPEFVAALSRELPGYDRRHAIKPGLTGWAQVRFRYGASVDDAREKLRYDLDYVERQSWAMDLRIVWATVGVVLTGFGAR